VWVILVLYFLEAVFFATHLHAGLVDMFIFVSTFRYILLHSCTPLRFALGFPSLQAIAPF